MLASTLFTVNQTEIMMYYNPAGIGTNMFRFCAQTNEE